MKDDSVFVQNSKRPRNVLPKIIENVGFDFSWDIRKVWALNYPVEDLSIEVLSWHFEIPFWCSEKGFYDLNPNQIINNSDKFKIEYERTMKADLNYPIDVMENKGNLLILDGLHRLVKAKILGYKNVKVRKIPRSEIVNIVKSI